MRSDMLEVVPAINPGEFQKPRAETPRDLPLASSTAVSAQESAQTVSPVEMQQAVDVLNQHFAASRADLRFTIERDLGVLVVTVVDANDGSVLMQLPTEQALRTAREVTRGQPRDALVKAVA
jgi:flagellar protein FlaG